MYKDKSGMFEDFGFKLVVINSLLEEETSFQAELEEMQEQYVEDFEEEYTCIPEMIAYFENLVLTQEDLDKVTELTFDGGEEIYYYIMPDWDGELEELDVKSIKGFKLLKNLEKVYYCSMCDEALMEEFEKNGIEVE